MAVLNIRNVPEDLMGRLKAAAGARLMPLREYVLEVLTENIPDAPVPEPPPAPPAPPPAPEPESPALKCPECGEKVRDFGIKWVCDKGHVTLKEGAKWL